jgi:gamma-glutamyltranspeptidase/glutathione hydrolase
MKIISLITLFTIIVSCTANKSYNEWQGEGFSGFDSYKVVTAKNYMISSSENLASEVGAKILAKGGNAIDAAIASQMVLNVIEPHSSGIGGGLFLIYYDAKTKKTIYFNGREIAPEGAFPRMFLDEYNEPRKFFDVVGGGLSVGTPGALKALKEAHQKYGKLPWKELFAPAIKIANDGFVLSEKIHVILEQVPYLKEYDGMRIYFDSKLKPHKTGTIIKNYELAKTFEDIANNGIETFYSGKIARNIVNAVQSSKVNPGFLSLQDLKNYKVKTGKLICSNYRVKYKICSMPVPSAGGITVLQTLGILENFDLSKIKPLSAEAIHLIAEANRLSYADRNEYLADISNAPVKEMLDKEYLLKRSQMISFNKSIKKVAPGDITNYQQKAVGKIFEKPSTTHLSIIDKYGNAVAMTSSIEYLFGSALKVNGFILNNQLTDFSFISEIDGKQVVNQVEPFKQPRSSMSPIFVFDNKNNLMMVIGSPGGPRISQFVIKTIIAYLDWNFDIQRAISMPNFVALNDKLELEKRTEIANLKSSLQKKGHNVVITDITSGINALVIKNNKIYGGADPRRQGSAIGN